MNSLDPIAMMQPGDPWLIMLVMMGEVSHNVTCTQCWPVHYQLFIIKIVYMSINATACFIGTDSVMWDYIYGIYMFK